MKMTLRWYGPGYDSVTLSQIRQIPGVSGVITTLYGTSPGEAWELEDIRGLKKTVEDAGLLIEGIESHERAEVFVNLKCEDDNACDYLQGYYFSKPLSQSEFVKFIKK